MGDLGTLDLAGFSPTLNGLNGGGTVTSSVSGSVNLTLGDGDASSAFAGVLQDGSGTLALTKIGNGTLTLSGTNTYIGWHDDQRRRIIGADLCELCPRDRAGDG